MTSNPYESWDCGIISFAVDLGGKVGNDDEQHPIFSVDYEEPWRMGAVVC